MPYFDHNATTPLCVAAREAWVLASEESWHNPSSPYREAARVRVRLEAARERLAEFLGAKAERLIFTSGATEGANAIFAYWARVMPASIRIAVNSTEHPCVLEAAAQFFPGRIEWLAVSDEGRVSVDRVRALLAAGGIGGVVAMAANNETGVLQPWQELAAVCREAGAEFFCDASQWLGKLPASGLAGVDWVIGSAHKFGGPKGVGFLQRTAPANGFHGLRGGGQERGHRGGTENFPGIASLVAALAVAEQQKMVFETERLRWRQQFEGAVEAALPGTRVVAPKAERLWNTVSLIMPKHENHRWVARLDKRGFQVSTGSACATGKEGPSHVLAAMGLSPENTQRVLRISAGWETAEEEWTALVKALVAVAGEIAPAQGVIAV